ncbi:sensor histidine kinase [Microbacterium sp.]|uniref:sensor histidine kinase n=1 Tax=Microbacterium sp. TaxID=51671 RepID=UPI003A85CE34
MHPPQPRRWRWHSPTVRTRIVAAITAVAALALIAVGVSAYFVERARVLDSIDDRLEANLASARHIVAAGDGDSGTWPGADAALEAVVQRMSPDDHTGALGIIDGRAVLVPGVPLDVDLRSSPGFASFAADAVVGGEPVIGTYSDGELIWRYLAAPIAVAGGADAVPVVFAMAYDVRSELAEINDAARAYLISAAIALVVIAAVAGVVSTRLLRPLREMRKTAQRVTARSLSERLPVTGRDDVSDLAATMNAMLDRLDAALDSQRRLLSDVGHELKTPLTIVHGHLEVMDADDPADVEESRALAIDELDRMSKLVSELAAAAALHGSAPITRREVDAGDLVRSVIRKAEGIVGAEVTPRAVADVVSSIDPERLTQAMLQLVQNAVTHGGGRVDIGSTVEGESLVLTVRDHGAGVPDSEKERVFERFHRGDPDTSGSGLGLNIVQMIARAHGGEAIVRDVPGGGAAFELRLAHAVVPAAGWQADAVDAVAVTAGRG